MPIYEYRCAACGHQEDHLQKVSEAPLSKCPACGKKKYQKQLTAAGFQLKGSGWYATDFRGGSTGAPAPADGATKNGEGAKTADSAAKPADGAAKPSEGAAKTADSGSTAAKSDAPKASAGGSDCH
jgi:putative FmdB family regulatory protein